MAQRTTGAVEGRQARLYINHRNRYIQALDKATASRRSHHFRRDSSFTSPRRGAALAPLQFAKSLGSPDLQELGCATGLMSHPRRRRKQCLLCACCVRVTLRVSAH